MTSEPEGQGPSAVWRDDIATPVEGARLVEILLQPREAYSRPERLAGHVSLSADEKRVLLCAWLRDLLADGRDGVPLGGAVLSALAELVPLDPGAAAVFRRAFAAQRLAAAS